MGTVSIISMVGMIFAFMVSVGLPTALFIIFFLKKKADYRCFAIGAVILSVMPEI